MHLISYATILNGFIAAYNYENSEQKTIYFIEGQCFKQEMIFIIYTVELFYLKGYEIVTEMIATRKATLHKSTSGFTLAELMVVVSVLGILVAIAVPVYTINTESAKTATDQANLKTLNSVTGLYRFSSALVDGDVFMGINIDEERMQKLVEAGFVSYPLEPVQDEAEFTWDIGLQAWKLEAQGVSTPLSPFGSTFTDISPNMIALMQKKYADTGSYGRTWGDYRYTDLGLDPADWSKPINHIYFRPRGEDLLITPEQGYTIVVNDLNGNEKKLQSTLNWNLVYSDKDGQWYYHSIKEENIIDISALKVVITNQ